MEKDWFSLIDGIKTLPSFCIALRFFEIEQKEKQD